MKVDEHDASIADLDLGPNPQPLESLMARLEKWLESQREFPYLFLGKRDIRRAAAKEISYRLLTLPDRKPGTEPRLNRQQSRTVMKLARKAGLSPVSGA